MANYLAIIREEPQGGYWAEVPALPGCYTQGETIEELEANLCEAISGVAAVLLEKGTKPDTNLRILDIAV